MKQRWLVTAAAMVALVFLSGAVLASATEPRDVPRMNKKELREKFGDPNVVILDVRTDENYKKGLWKIKSAVRESPTKVNEWAAKLDKDKTYVLYCVEPAEANSVNVAIKMMDMGFKNIYVLKGGFIEWLKRKYPVEIKEDIKMPEKPVKKKTK